MRNRTLFNTLSDAYSNKSHVAAVVRVGDEKRLRIGTVDLLVRDAFRSNVGYVTFALMNGTYRTAKLRDVQTVMVL
jgi:hypothetical protein